MYLVRTDGAAWCVRTGPGVFEVQDGPADSPPEVTVSGPYEAVLRWVWNRESSPATQVSVDGSPEAVTLLERCIAVATQ